jgi:hypothetical protein
LHPKPEKRPVKAKIIKTGNLPMSSKPSRRIRFSARPIARQPRARSQVNFAFAL